MAGMHPEKIIKYSFDFCKLSFNIKQLYSVREYTLSHTNQSKSIFAQDEDSNKGELFGILSSSSKHRHQFLSPNSNHVGRRCCWRSILVLAAGQFIWSYFRLVMQEYVQRMKQRALHIIGSWKIQLSQKPKEERRSKQSLRNKSAEKARERMGRKLVYGSTEP